MNLLLLKGDKREVHEKEIPASLLENAKKKASTIRNTNIMNALKV
jgi:hypothetical protein